MKLKYLFFLLTFSFILSCRKKDEAAPASPGAGAMAHDFLSSGNYDNLIIQIQSVQGFELTNATLDNLKTFLQQRLNKPMGISIVQSTIGSPGKATLSLNDIRTIEQNNRSVSTDGRTLTAYFFVGDADFTDDSGDGKVLGVAYGPTSMALFEKTILDFSGDIGQSSQTMLESAVIVHEFGHILGLVNRGSAMQVEHVDKAHANHCNNSQCLMYYQLESSATIGNMSSLPTLDNNCINDLRGNGGK